MVLRIEDLLLKLSKDIVLFFNDFCFGDLVFGVRYFFNFFGIVCCCFGIGFGGVLLFLVLLLNGLYFDLFSEVMLYCFFNVFLDNDIIFICFEFLEKLW